MSNTIYNPDKWVLLEIKQGDSTIQKVLGGWSGGYLDSDNWRVSSGVVKTEKDGDYILFHNHSGSVYKCHKDSEGTTALSGSMLSSWQEDVKDKENISIEVIEVE